MPLNYLVYDCTNIINIFYLSYFVPFEPYLHQEDVFTIANSVEEEICTVLKSMYIKSVTRSSISNPKLHTFWLCDIKDVCALQNGWISGEKTLNDFLQPPPPGIFRKVFFFGEHRHPWNLIKVIIVFYTSAWKPLCPWQWVHDGNSIEEGSFLVAWRGSRWPPWWRGSRWT